MIEEIKEHAKRLQEEKAALPPTPSADPQQELLALISEFKSDVRDVIKGSPGFEHLIQAAIEHYTDFAQAIKLSIPEYIPFESSDPRSKATQLPEAPRHSDESMTGEAPIKRRPPRVYLDEIRQKVKDSRTRELPFSGLVFA